MVTTTAEIFEDTMGSFMLPGMSSPEQTLTYNRVVRFDNECVLIPKTCPARSKMPVVLTKSYSLPLWKKKPNLLSDWDVEDGAGSSSQPQSPEDNRVIIKVPIPTFRRRSSRSPPRGRSATSSPIITKSLPSCLVHRSPLASSSAKPLLPIRRPSLPIYHRRQDELTIPLRDCCADCERITDECLKEGDSWKEKFSRGARRRRSASLDCDDSSMTTPSSHARNARAFNSPSTELSANRDLTSRFSATAAAFSITVDEVDKRRKSLEYSMEDTDFIRALSHPSSAPPSPSCSPVTPFASSSRYPRRKLRDRELSSSSTASNTDESLPDVPDSHRLRSSPIEEEDETQLFPLPRRSRSNTPSPSPSPKVSPPPSPNGSILSLTSISPKQNSSSLEESVLSNSLSRKVDIGHLVTSITPSTIFSSPPSPPLSPLLKHMRGPVLGLNIPKTGERAATSHVSPKGPRPSPFLMNSKALSTPTEHKPSSAIPNPSTTPNIASDQNTASLLVPSSSNSLSTADDIPKNNPSFEPAKLQVAVTLPESTNNTKAPSSSPTQSPITQTPSQGKRKLSFTIPFIKAGEAIRDVGVDVLKGVSSMSGSVSVVGRV